MKSHIQLLLKVEEARTSSLMWGRKDKDTIWVSTVGYIVQSHMDLEAELLKLGCRYDVKLGVQKFDRTCGRTVTFFKEPKKKRGAA